MLTSEANSSVNDAVLVLHCCSCGHPTKLEELSECLACGAMFCGKASRGCDAVCYCGIRPIMQALFTNSHQIHLLPA